MRPTWAEVHRRPRTASSSGGTPFRTLRLTLLIPWNVTRAHAQTSGLPRGLAVEPKRGRRVPVRPTAAHMLVADLRAVLHDVHDRHGMAAAEAVLLLHPVDDDARLRLRAEPVF